MVISWWMKRGDPKLAFYGVTMVPYLKILVVQCCTFYRQNLYQVLSGALPPA